MVNKQDSNVTGLSIAEEASVGVLPGSPVWYAQEPNSYGDFGGQIQTVARDTINASRQRQKGTTTDFDASGSFNMDVTQNNLTRLLQGFVFSDAHEKMDTQPLNATAIVISAVDATDDGWEAASGLDDFAVGDIVLASGFTNSANNGIHVLDNVASGEVQTPSALVTETPPAGARLQTVGYQFASGDAEIEVTGGVASLTTTTKDLEDLGLNIGEWVFIGGDSAGLAFATSPKGYARIASISEHAIVFDKVTSAFATDDGSGKTIQIFYGTFYRNEKDPTLIQMRTYQLERSLGNDGNGVQSEYLVGSAANELTINIPLADKATVDLAFVAIDHEFRTGTQGLKNGTRVAALGEDAFNTSSKVYRQMMNILAPGTLQPTALFAYTTEGSININNNVTGAKAVGVLGSFDLIVGNFTVGGNLEAYFSTVAAVEAVRNNADVTFDIILAQENAGMVYDLPLISLGDGRLNVTKDAAIKVPLETAAAEGPAGYTLGVVNFAYLPNGAMPA